MKRAEELKEIFRDVEETEKALVGRLIEEAAFLEEQMAELKKLPFIRTKPGEPALQKTTPAAKLYKECSQSYANIIRILLNVIRKTESDAENELLRKLEEFT